MCWLLGGRAFGRLWGHEGGALLSRMSAPLRGPRQLPRPFTRWGYKETSAVWNLKNGLHQNPTILVLWPQTSSLQTVRINFWCLQATQSLVFCNRSPNGKLQQHAITNLTVSLKKTLEKLKSPRIYLGWINSWWDIMKHLKQIWGVKLKAELNIER